jgi:hypothetical protein
VTDCEQRICSGCQQAKPLDCFETTTCRGKPLIRRRCKTCMCEYYKRKHQQMPSVQMRREAERQDAADADRRIREIVAVAVAAYRKNEGKQRVRAARAKVLERNFVEDVT